MIISKDLSLTQNEEGFGLALFSWSSARKIIITDDELPLLINALQAEYAAQQSVQLTGLRRCPACKNLLEEKSVYCDECGTDTPRA